MNDSILDLAHLDLHFGNFYVDVASGTITLFDFDDCAYGWYMMDVAMPLFDVLVLCPDSDKEAFTAHFLNHYLRGYTAERRLSAFWLWIALRDSDLIGTWQSTDEAGVATDEIILREDGRYKQTYQQSNGYRYESAWNWWWIEHKLSGGMYVHLEGMRYCHSTDEICARADGGGGDSL